jgi:hypothetical protein
MNKEEALAILEREMERYRMRTFAELQRLIGDQDGFKVAGPGGATYYIEMDAVWDAEPGGDLRVIGMIDDGGWWRSISPLTSDFIISPDGSFVGE